MFDHQRMSAGMKSWIDITDPDGVKSFEYQP